VRPAKNHITAYARPLIASALIAGGLAQLALPVFADVPLADSSISNTANASYEDPNVPDVPIETVSNTVTIKVAKVAGIVVKKVDFTNEVTPDSFKPNDTIYSNFTVENTGNDAVKFKVPKLADVSSNTTFQEVQYWDTKGTASTTDDAWVTVTASTGADSQVIDVGGTLKVRVKLQIKSNAVANDDIVVTLGHTATAGTINAARGLGAEDSHDNDVYTVDVTTAGGLVRIGGNAANGVREASDRQTIKVNAVKQAFASVTLTHDPAVVVTATTDDIKYNISVNVPTTDPNGSGKIADDLAPTTVKLNSTTTPIAGNAGTGVDTPRVIIANPLPAGTTLKETPAAVTDWTVVYAVDTGAVGTVVWSTTPPASLADVKQVGYIYTPTGVTPTAGASLPTSSTPYSGFSVKVTTSGLGEVVNTATINGTTSADPTKADLTKPVTNTSTDTFTTFRAATISDIYNGPSAKPQATGPGNDNNKDFTNKSIAIAAADAVRDSVTGLLKQTTAATTLLQRTSTFNNTVENATNVAGDIYLLPTLPVVGTLPVNTIVKIENVDGSDIRTYTATASGFTTTDLLKGPLKLAAAGFGKVSYSVVVTLPIGIDQLVGYPVPITAFTGGTIANGITTVPSDKTAQNITIDRVYTGYIDLIKEVRALDADTQQADDTIPYLNNRDNAAAILNIKATPGKFIQYRIRAKNISDVAGSGAVDSQVIEAHKIKMVENGALAPNNWAISTTHSPDSAKTFLGANLLTGTITFDSGAKNNTQTNISKYDVDLGTTKVAPQETASFVFLRKVNKPDPQ
jgi:hypothetical protein